MASVFYIDIDNIRRMNLDFNLRPSRDRNWQLLNSGEPLPKVSKKPVSVREVLPEPFQVERIITTKKCPVEVRL